MFLLSDEIHQEDANGASSSWDDDCEIGGQFDDGNAYSDVEDSSTLISQPRQVCLLKLQFFSIWNNYAMFDWRSLCFLNGKNERKLHLI